MKANADFPKIDSFIFRNKQKLRQPISSAGAMVARKTSITM
jgi:hypothetical protein